MNVINMVHFIAQLLIAGLMIRFIQIKYPESAIGRALGVVY